MVGRNMPNASHAPINEHPAIKLAVSDDLKNRRLIKKARSNTVPIKTRGTIHFVLSRFLGITDLPSTIVPSQPERTLQRPPKLLYMPRSKSRNVWRVANLGVRQ